MNAALVPAVSILIVEDDPVTREVLRLMLAKRFPEMTFHFATGGREGVETFGVHAPKIVITDIQMPEMDGIEMAGAIRAMRPETKFIVLTAYGTERYRRDFGVIGVHDCLAKPIEFPKLFAAIEECLAELAGTLVA